jgi:hypothetical protein
VRHDQVVFGVDRGLHVVADHAGSAPAGGHGARTGVRQRHLFVRRGLDLLFHRLQGLHLLAQAGDLVLDAGGLGLGDVAVFAVGPIQGRKVARDAGVDLVQALGDLATVKFLSRLFTALNLLPSPRPPRPASAACAAGD